MSKRFLLTVLVGALIAAPAAAKISAMQTVEKEIVVTDDNGDRTVTRAKAEKVTPGETVVYTLSYRNEAQEPAEELVLVMPVPEEIAYIESSVSGAAASVSFSADGGQTYVARGRLSVIENGVSRPARGDEITHIRWALNEPVPPGANGEVSFKGVLQ